MYVRISTVTGASDIDGGLALLWSEALPQMEQQKGFGGIGVAGDREARIVSVLTAWETEADRDASESAAHKARADVARAMGGEVSVERYEQTVFQASDAPSGPGAKLHVREVKVDPARLDENLEFFRDNVVPELKARPGFLAVRQLVDRSTGEVRAGTVWTDARSLAASLAESEQRRPQARDRGVEFGEAKVLDLFFPSS
jgi:heme-degrading monooxygenase HmoA